MLGRHAEVDDLRRRLRRRGRGELGLGAPRGAEELPGELGLGLHRDTDGWLMVAREARRRAHVRIVFSPEEGCQDDEAVAGADRLEFIKKVLTQVTVGENEGIESALRRFKRQVSKSGIFTDLKRLRHHETPIEKYKRKLQQRRKARRR